MKLSGKSLCLFGQKNNLRLFSERITSWKYFEATSCFVILISTINMLLYNPLNDPESTLALSSLYLDYFLASIFTLEAILLILTYGFMMNGK